MKHIEMSYKNWTKLLADFYEANKFLLREVGMDLDKIDAESELPYECTRNWPTFVPTPLIHSTAIAMSLEDIRRKLSIARASGLSDDNLLVRTFKVKEDCMLKHYNKIRNELANLYSGIEITPVIFVEVRE